MGKHRYLLDQLFWASLDVECADPKDGLLDWIRAQRNAIADFDRLARWADGL